MDSKAAGRELVGVIEALKTADVDVGCGGTEPLKSAPRGIDKDHPRIEFLRYKGLMASRRLSAETASVSEIAGKVIDFWDESAPLVDWLSVKV